MQRHPSISVTYSVCNASLFLHSTSRSLNLIYTFALWYVPLLSSLLLFVTLCLQLWHSFSNLKRVCPTPAQTTTPPTPSLAARWLVCLAVTWKFLRLESFSFWQRTSHVKAKGGIKIICMRNMTFLIKQSRARVCKWFLNVSCGCPWNFYAKHMNVLVVGNWWGNPSRILNLCCRHAEAQ